jgi:hypothetical protein
MDNNVIIKMNKISKFVFLIQWGTCFRNTLFITLHNTLSFVLFIADKILMLQK